MLKRMMLFIGLLVMMMAGGVMGTATQAQTCPTPTGWGTYTIQRGDTLYRLANRYDTTVASLRTANCITGNLIYAGRTLRVPAVANPDPGTSPMIDIQQPLNGTTLTPNQPFTVSGQARALFEGGLVLQFLDPRGRIIIEQPVTAGGDVATGGTGPWSASISLNVPDGTPVNIIALASSARDGTTVAIDNVSVRFGAATGGCSVRADWPIHTVQRGENLYRIGLRYGATVTTLAQANCLINPNRITAGQQLHVPVN